MIGNVEPWALLGNYFCGQGYPSALKVIDFMGSGIGGEGLDVVGLVNYNSEDGVAVSFDRYAGIGVEFFLNGHNLFGIVRQVAVVSRAANTGGMNAADGGRLQEVQCQHSACGSGVDDMSDEGIALLITGDGDIQGAVGDGGLDDDGLVVACCHLLDVVRWLTP